MEIQNKKEKEKGKEEEEECPLCKISLETLEKLKKAGEHLPAGRQEKLRIKNN